MGFDQDSNLPLIQPKKRTTKVNLAIVVSILVFFFATAAVAFWTWRNSEEAPAAAPSVPSPP